MINLDAFFHAKSIAIVGASKTPGKVGHVIFRNLLDGGYHGKIYLINPNTKDILGHKCYNSLYAVKEPIDLAVIAIPAALILETIKDCAKKKIKDVIIVTAGFEEVGNFKLRDDMAKLLKKYNIRVIGPNCLGVYDAHSKLDTLFLPRYRMARPDEGGISFVVQSGAVGSTILDLAATQGMGVAKFISYGNAINVDEADIIEYLSKDSETTVICLYVEGIRNGKKFIEVCKKVKKPIIALKGGVTDAGTQATLSHTGSLAGLAEVYTGAFKQCGVIQVLGLEEMFNIARILEKSIKPNGRRVQIITNGGGFGILCTDAVVLNGLEMAKMSNKSVLALKKQFPPIVVVKNPMDLIGDATTPRYKAAIEASVADPNIDILLVIVLYQTPLITTDIVDVISEVNELHKKPIIVVSTGGDFTEVLMRSLEDNGVPCYQFPESAVRAIAGLVQYYGK